MEYGLRRYEAAQRLMWFLFFLVCAALAYPVAKVHLGAHAAQALSAQSFRLDTLKSVDFWTQLQWIQVDPLGRAMVYLTYAALFLLAGRFLWLLVQYVGKFIVKTVLSSNIKKALPRPAGIPDRISGNQERLFPAELILRKISRFPLPLIFHPFQRLRLLLNKSDRTISSEELMEKERRIVETDWQVFYSSWAPFRWLMWLLPLLGLMQASYMIYMQILPAVSGQKDIQEVLSTALTGLLPLVQVIGITVIFRLAAGLLRRIEDFYLSNVDALLYDQFLSRLPFQSSDTVILLDALQKHFQEIHTVLKRLENSLGAGRVSSDMAARVTPEIKS